MAHTGGTIYTEDGVITTGFSVTGNNRETRSGVTTDKSATPEHLCTGFGACSADKSAPGCHRADKIGVLTDTKVVVSDRSTIDIC